MTNLVSRGAKRIQLGLWLMVVCAAWAAISLVMEWYPFTQSMPDQGWNLQIARLVLTAIGNERTS